MWTGFVIPQWETLPEGDGSSLVIGFNAKAFPWSEVEHGLVLEQCREYIFCHEAERDTALVRFVEVEDRMIGHWFDLEVRLYPR